MTAPDPWKGFRGVCAGTLILEAIAVLLALPAVSRLASGLSWGAVVYLLVLAALMIVGAGLQRRRWAMAYNLALQAAMIAAWFIHPAIGVLGILGLVTWTFFLYFRREVARKAGKS